jgi:hypothetical protein
MQGKLWSPCFFKINIVCYFPNPSRVYLEIIWRVITKFQILSKLHTEAKLTNWDYLNLLNTD